MAGESDSAIDSPARETAWRPDDRPDPYREVVEDGANDPEHIAGEMMMPFSRLDPILDDFVERGILEIRRQGGKTDHARGARRPLYFVSEKYQSKSE
jgi:hypothetical protein